MIDPAEIPDGLEAEGLRVMTIYDGCWRPSDQFVCDQCGSPAYLHPYTNWIWGCKRCGFTTQSVSLFFKKLQAA